MRKRGRKTNITYGKRPQKKVKTTIKKDKIKEEVKYVDGYRDYGAFHILNTNDDGWHDCELNPRQQTAVYGCLPVPKQGTGYSERDGRKIYVKSIRIKGVITWSAVNALAAGGNQGFVRLCVVKDTKSTGTEISAENVMGAGTGSDGMAGKLADAGVNCLTNPDGWGRYKVLVDRTYKSPPVSAFHDGVDGATNSISIPFKMTVKANCYMNFSASTGAIGSIIDNSFHLIGAQSQLGSAVTMSYVARTAFIG